MRAVMAHPLSTSSCTLPLPPAQCGVERAGAAKLRRLILSFPHCRYSGTDRRRLLRLMQMSSKHKRKSRAASDEVGFSPHGWRAL